ncbi:hypothetical protein FJ692_24580 [Pseudomonas fluorescens]|nr:hypothetical protein C1751_16960 [Pseudomonas fluorescens]TPV52232.1 hypothetical protein FJ692_24580 [Pseudomonas fluorescens]
MPVGASLLAKNFSDNACFLNKRGAYWFFASTLAPTGSRQAPFQSSLAVEFLQEHCHLFFGLLVAVGLGRFNAFFPRLSC